MCMGFGCNAAGVISARIIDSPKERMIAIITNNFVPCNGRFASLIILATIFVGGSGIVSVKVALVVLLAIISAFGITLIVSYILSNTILKGQQSSFVLELPPYRRPNFWQIIKRSVRDRILFVLGRAITVAAPAGVVIWLLQNLTIDGISVLTYVANFLQPLGNIMGLDGYILTAFILGLPANEIVLPIIIMCYTGNSGLLELNSMSELGTLLTSHGWNVCTAICMIIFSLNHFPCATTLLTIRKETKSIKWTVISFIVPTIVGVLLCMFTNLIFHLF